MPEGPEVRRQADRIRKAIGHTRPSHVHFGLEKLRSFEGRLSGRRVEEVESRGKALLVHFEEGLTVYSHNQLYGRWYIVRAGQLPRTRRQLRVAFQSPQQWALLYSASEIAVLETGRLQEHPVLSRLGPDVLDERVEVSEVAARLETKEYRQRRLAALLLDQGFVAGLGNYLRSEILFVAQLLPEQRPKDLRPEQRLRLATEILGVARRAYRTGGITVEEDLARRLKAEGLRKRQLRHYVFGRSGQLCRRCETPVVKREAAGRRIYVCPGCQI